MVSIFNVDCNQDCSFAWVGRNSSVSLPSGLLSSNSVFTAIEYLDSVLFEDLSLLQSRVDTSVLSVDISRGVDTNQLPSNFEFTQRSQNMSLNTPACVFFDLGFSNRWLSTGCTLKRRTAIDYTCSCNHMTNFAVLSSLQTSSTTTDPILTTLSYISIGVSVPCMLVLLVIFLSLPKLMNLHRFLLCHLAFTLSVALSLFVVFVDSTSSPACDSMAFILHYFLIAAFCFMLLDGQHLWYTFSTVFMPIIRRRDYFGRAALGYLVPGIIVGVSYALLGSRYRRQDICWLSQGM